MAYGEEGGAGVAAAAKAGWATPEACTLSSL